MYMHIKERYRASNTGKLVDLALPGTEMLCQGVLDDENRLQELLKEYEGRALVLFPGFESVSTSEYLAKYDERTQGVDDNHVQKSILIIVLDGTWRQAKRLTRHVDCKIPRVALTPDALSSFFCRKQTQSDRICTIEAVEMFLREFHPKSADAVSKAFAIFLHAFAQQATAEIGTNRYTELQLKQIKSKFRMQH